MFKHYIQQFINKFFGTDRKLCRDLWQSSWVKAKNERRCLVIPLLEKNELIDNRLYTIYYKNPNSSMRMKEDEAYWNAESGCFAFATLSRYNILKYEDIYGCMEYNQNTSGTIFQYDPTKVNALDLKVLNDICFNIGDDSTQVEVDDIWDNLIKYFDERGIYPLNSED